MEFIETAPGAVASFRVLRSLTCYPISSPHPFHRIPQFQDRRFVSASPASYVTFRSALISAHLRQKALLRVSAPPRCAFLFTRDFGNFHAQIHLLYPLRTLRPVVHPAHNNVALLRIVPVAQKVLALKLHFHVLVPPLAFGHLAYRQTIRKRRLPALHRKSQPSRHHAKRKHHSGFVGRGMRHSRYQQRIAIHRAVHHQRTLPPPSSLACDSQPLLLFL